MEECKIPFKESLRRFISTLRTAIVDIKLSLSVPRKNRRSEGYQQRV